MLSYQESCHVNLHFVIPESCQSKDDVIDEMKMAFQECLEADFSPEWISEGNCLTMSYTKLDVFIMQEFSGEVFNKLRSTKSVVCGPVCLRTCLAERTNIPENNSPVFTTAMRNLCITASNSTLQKKIEIKEKVRFMGGIYTSNLVEASTHLVSNAVRSAKYEKATEKGMKVMTEKWIEAVWEASLKRNVKATDPEFDKYKCKIFQDLQLTCSNLDRAEKEKIKKLVNDNGGSLTPQLLQHDTSLLVISSPHGDKYKFAKSWNLPCVYPSWITESLEKGFAVPTRNHLLSTEMKCSTPTSIDLSNFTLGAADQCSLICHDTERSRVNETAISNASVITGRNTRSQISEGSKYKKILETLNITTAKRAGLFVDGCKIFLSGFTVQEVERLRRLLSLGGATIFNELSETVSYVIVGDHVINDVKTISNMTRRPYVVSLEWLTASIKQKGPASGHLHSCLVQMKIPVEPPSPLSQKGLELLQTTDGNTQDSLPEKQALMTLQPAVRKLFKDFAKPAEANRSETLNNGSANNTQNSQNSISQNSESQITEFFKGLTFNIEIEDEDDEQLRKMTTIITSYGGFVVGSSFKGVPDYAIVPIDGEVRHVTASEIVTYLWVEECYDNEECVNVEYYHQPFTVHSDKKPLKGYCLVTTSYTGKEKVFLTLLGEALGATCQDVLARKGNETKGLFASTHLIASAPSGSKYEAAKKWNIPAVTKDWLLTCARNGMKVAEGPYLVTNEDNVVTSVNKNGEEPKQVVVNESHGTSKDTLMGPPNCSKSSVDIRNGPNCSQSAPNCTKSIMEPPVSTKTPIGTSNSTQSPTGPSYRPRSSVTPLRISIAPTGDTRRSSMVSPNVGKTSGGTQCSRDMLSRVTPCKRKSSCMSQQDSDLSPFHVDTPDTPYGQVFGITPTRSSKKRWKKYLDNIGTYAKEESPTVTQRRDSTPMSELRKQVFEKFFTPEDFEGLHTNSSDGKNIGMTSSQSEDGKENCDPVSITPQQLNRSEANVSLPNVKKMQSPTTVTETMASSSIGTPEDRVSQHLQKLDRELASHTPPETTLKRHHDINVIQPPGYTSTNLSYSKQIHKSGLIDSQPITIDWEDPIETAARAKLNKMNFLNQIEKSKPRRFALGSDLEVNAYVKIIRDFGGEVINSPTFDSSTTHIIVDKPIRSEKLLCSLAAGKWILHSNYLLEVEKQQKWLPEEDYEFGNPSSVNNIPNYTDTSYELANAAYKWRSKLKNSEGAFSGMKILVKNTSKKGSLERLISAGCGDVVDETCISEATHCCMNSYSDNMYDFVKELIKHKIPCVKPVFLGEYLYKDPTPSIQDHILPGLKDLYRDVYVNQTDTI